MTKNKSQSTATDFLSLSAWCYLVMSVIAAGSVWVRASDFAYAIAIAVFLQGVLVTSFLLVIVNMAEDLRAIKNDATRRRIQEEAKERHDNMMRRQQEEKNRRDKK